MPSKERVLDDIAQLAGGAVGLVSDASQQVKNAAQTKLNALAHDMDLVPREDFEKVEAMVVKLREEQNALIARVNELESIIKQRENNA